MNATLTWDETYETLLHITFSGKWDWSVYDSVIEDARTLLANRPTALIINVSDSHPPLGGIVGYARRALTQSFPANVTRVTVVGAGFMGLVLETLLGDRITFADTELEARAAALAASLPLSACF